MSTADQVLFERWSRSRDAEAFTELTRRYAGMVHASCLRVLQNRSDAEDATLECFEKLATLRRGPQGHMGAWLHRMAVNAALDRLRSDRRRKEREQRYSDAQPHNAEPMWHDLYEHVDEAIAALPDNLRGPIVAHFLDNETHAAIAEREGVSRSAITQRIDRAIEALRDNLRKRGVIVGAATLTTLLAENAKAEPLPAALSQALGKLALSGAPGAAVAASATAAWWLAAGTIATVALLAVGAFTALRRERPVPPPTPTSAAATPVVEISSVAPAQNDALSQPPLPPTETAFSGTRILGRTYDKETGQGVAGVVLQSRLGCKGNHEYPNTTSDKDGRYELALPCDGLWAVDVEAPMPYTWTRPATVYTTEDRATEGVDFALERGRRIAGRVVNPAGKPLAGADVRGEAENDAAFNATTRADGTFEGAVAPPARNLHLTAQLAQKSAPQMASLRYGPYVVPQTGLEGLILVLYEASTVSGRIVDIQGQPVGRVTAVAGIETYPGADDPNLSPQLREFSGGDSGDDGSFEIQLPTPGTYRLGVLGSSSMPVLARVEVKPGDAVTGIQLHIPADQAVQPREEPPVLPFELSGTVVDVAGEPVKDVSVMARNERGEGGHALTGEDGRFEVALADREGNRLSIACSGYSETTVRDVIADGQERRIVLQHRNSLELRVVRADTGEPVQTFQALVQPNGLCGSPADLEVSLAATSAQFIQSLSMTETVRSGDGSFRAENLDAGATLVAVRAPGMKLGLQCVTIPRTEDGPGRALVRLTPDSAPLAGRVLDNQERPVAGAVVWINERPVVSSRDAGMGRQTALAETDAEGTFRLTGLLPGKAYVCAHHPDFAPVSVQTEVGKEPASVELKFRASGVLEGHVLQGGQPLAQVAVSCRYPAEPQDAYDSANTARDGSFRFPTAVPGTVALYARVEQGRDVSRELDAIVVAGRVTQVTLDIPAGTASVEGAVAVGGLPATNVNVDVDLPVREGRARLQAVFSGNRYHLEELPAGACTIEVSGTLEGSNSTAGEASVTLTEGQTTVQDFAL